MTWFEGLGVLGSIAGIAGAWLAWRAMVEAQNAATAAREARDAVARQSLAEACGVVLARNQSWDALEMKATELRDQCLLLGMRYAAMPLEIKRNLEDAATALDEAILSVRELQRRPQNAATELLQSSVVWAVDGTCKYLSMATGATQELLEKTKR